MSSIVFDIETLAFPLNSFDEKQHEYLFKFCKSEEERLGKIQELALSPLTARVITIGMANPENNHGKVLFLSDEQTTEKSKDGTVEYVSFTEESSIIEQFWETIKHYNQFITFNGRSFDCPFIMMRSAILGVKPSRILIPYRYDTKIHCDLMEQLTFYNAMRRFNLDFYCKSFGIRSPKEDGITGLELAPLFEQKQFRTIAEYCFGDVLATAELYRRWKEYINIDNG